MTLRLIFMGTPEFAVPTLLELIGRGHEIAAVYSRPVKPSGRGSSLRPSPVEHAAQRFKLPVMTPASLRTAQAEAAFRSHGAAAAIVVAYGLLLPAPILDAMPLGCFNLHASLLPRWRGAAPIHRAIMAGDKETGVSVMRMNAGLDAGPLALIERFAIGPDMTAGEVHDELARLGADLMGRVLGALERAALELTPQPATGVTVAPKIGSRETRIDWARPWQEVHDHCRGLSPAPGAWFEVADERDGSIRVKVLRSTRGEGGGPPGTVLDGSFNVACGLGAVRIVELQRAGRVPMGAEEFLRGFDVRGMTLR
jgi:methionyl-tRNA formyltransferase